MSVEQVTRWRTSDGKEHSSQEWAEQWEKKLDAADAATAMLDGGSSVADCLRSMEYKSQIDPILEKVTKDTQLVISYWQCQDTPGYKPTRFCADGRIVAYGNAGGWSGPYGGKITVEALVRYAKTQGTILGSGSDLAETVKQQAIADIKQLGENDA